MRPNNNKAIVDNKLRTRLLFYCTLQATNYGSAQHVVIANVSGAQSAANLHPAFSQVVDVTSLCDE